MDAKNKQPKQPKEPKAVMYIGDDGKIKFKNN